MLFRSLFGDEVLSLYARELLTRKPGSTVIADVKCSSRLFNDIKAHGGTQMCIRDRVWGGGGETFFRKFLLPLPNVPPPFT